MRSQLFIVAFILVSSCATVANADTCTNCKVRWMMGCGVGGGDSDDFRAIDIDVAGPGCIFEG